MRLLHWKDSFKRELRREIRLFIIVTLGFTIAFTWRQTIFDASLSFVKKTFSIEGPLAASITASLFITLVCLIILLLNSKFLQDPQF